MTRGPMHTRCSTVRSCCQVCQLDLTDMPVKEYFKLKKACPQHVSADEVYIPGKDCPHRFCHQCGKYEPLTCFDGNRRSCRDRLVKRRKPPAGSKPAAPDSSSATYQQQASPASPDTQLSETTIPQLTAAATAAAPAAYSMSWGFDTAAASPAASWSVLDGCAEDTADFCELDAQLQQLFQDQLGSCNMPGAELSACQLQDPQQQHPQQQQQGFMGMLTEGEGDVTAAASSSPAAAASGDDFVDLLAAAMQDELQQCLEEQQQQQQAVQLQHKSMGPQAVLVPAGYTPPAPMPGDFRTCSLPSSCTTVLLHGADSSAAGVAAAAPAMTAPMESSELWSDNSSASSTLPMMEIYPGFAAAQAAMPATQAPAASAIAAGNCGMLAAAAGASQQGPAASEDLLRLQRMAQLRAELERLERYAAATLPGMHAMQSCSSVMPAHMAMQSAPQQLGNTYGASFAPGVEGAVMVHQGHAQMVQQQGAAAVNQRLQQLHSQVVQMSGQLNQLRAMLSAGQPAMAESMHGGSLCFGMV